MAEVKLRRYVGLAALGGDRDCCRANDAEAGKPRLRCYFGGSWLL